MASAYPVLMLGSGMNGPDDLLYMADGTVLVGEHGDGHIAQVGGTGGLVRLPQVVPEAEGIAQVGDTIYIADQFHARVVALTASGVRTLIQLQPVPSGENLDGIAAQFTGSGLVIPDSPHGTVLFVDLSGRVTSRVGGLSRPAGAFPDPALGGYLIADENASAVFEVRPGARPTKLAGGLPGADDAVRTDTGHLLVILPAAGRLYDVTSGHDLARGLRNPQGLGFDEAQNVLVTESDAGRLDLVVRTFVVELPPPNVKLAPGQTVCLGIVRGPGYSDPVALHDVIGAVTVSGPVGSTLGELRPSPCSALSCTVTLILQSSAGLEHLSFTYRD